MNVRFYTLTLVIGLFAPSTFARVIMGPVTNTANGHIYYLLSQNTWTDSQAEAVARGGNLVTINDADEQEWVFETFTETGISRGFWIGLNDLGGEGVFSWVSGETSTYSHWHPGEPNNNGPSGESFVHMWGEGGGGGVEAGFWNDLPDYTNYADFTLHGVVEIVPAPRLEISVAYVNLRWRSESNRSYQVQYASSLTSNMWMDLGEPVPGNGATNTVLESAQQSPRRFYRVIELR